MSGILHCEIAHNVQGRASQKALNLVDVSTACFHRISFQFFLINSLYLQKCLHTDDKVPALLSVAITDIRIVLNSVAIKQCAKNHSRLVLHSVVSLTEKIMVKRNPAGLP